MEKSMNQMRRTMECSVSDVGLKNPTFELYARSGSDDGRPRRAAPTVVLLVHELISGFGF